MHRVLSKCYPEPLQFAKVWSNLFFQRKTATTRNNSVFPGLRKNTTGASKLHFLEKYASCLKLPKLHRAAAMMDDQIQWSVQRGRSPNHTGTDRKPALALAPPHSRRLRVLDPWQPNFIIFLWNKSYLPERCVGETPPKALPCLAVLTGPAPAPRFSLCEAHRRSFRTTWPPITLAGLHLDALDREPALCRVWVTGSDAGRKKN